MMDLFFVGVVDLLVLFNANLNSRVSLLNAFLAPGSFRKKLHTVCRTFTNIAGYKYALLFGCIMNV